jgi:capsular polysaccharide export protein
MFPESLALLASSRRILLLQGPMGPFFARLAQFLEAGGAHVGKVNFNGGDEAFYRGRPTLAYRAEPSQWPAWLAHLLEADRIEAIALFGQARPYHRSAIEVARRLGVRVFVFEEGYFRPDYVTLEPGGVNGHSTLPRSPASYAGLPADLPPKPRHTGQRFSQMAWYATVYALAAAAARRRYPHGEHHRELHPAMEALRWLRSGWRKIWYALAERHHLEQLTAPSQSGRWFLLPLQVHNDSQLAEHSPYDCVTEVLRQVVASFADHAPAKARLVVKHHPMDRAYRDYSGLIRRLRRLHGLGDRLVYVHDLHLPTLLRHARGVVTVNSTTGLQAMFHGRPVCVLGDAIYGMPGLADTGPLDAFWSEQPPVDRRLFARFRAEVIRRTQLNASFYGRTPVFDTRGPALQHLSGVSPAATTLHKSPNVTLR